MAASPPCKRARGPDDSASEDKECGPPLSSAEVEAYSREGWVVPKARLPAAYIDHLRSTLDRVIAENPGTRPERLVSAHVEDRGKEGVKGSQDFLDLAQHPLLLNAVEQLIGPDICLWGCQIFCKPGGDGMEVPMHQDGQYWPIRPLATVTAWVALDCSDKGNGCLRVVPRSHTGKRHFEHFKSEAQALVLSQAIKEAELGQLEEPVDVELEPGQFSLHDVYTVHGSNANTSSRRRAGVALRYMPTTSVLERQLFRSDASAGYTVDWENRRVFLLRGADRSDGKNLYTALPRSLGVGSAPPGFTHVVAAVAEASWKALKQWLEQDDSIPWEQAIEGRRVAQWGVRYDYARQAVDLTSVAPVPARLRELLPGVGPEFTQCIVNEYGAADGIPWHVDDLSFGPDVLVFCFGDPRPLLLRPSGKNAGPRLSVPVGHLDSYRLAGQSRYDWEHSIPQGAGHRVSVTFRSLASSSAAPSPDGPRS